MYNIHAIVIKLMQGNHLEYSDRVRDLNIRIYNLSILLYMKIITYEYVVVGGAINLFTYLYTCANKLYNIISRHNIFTLNCALKPERRLWQLCKRNPRQQKPNQKPRKIHEYCKVLEKLKILIFMMRLMRRTATAKHSQQARPEADC